MDPSGSIFYKSVQLKILSISKINFYQMTWDYKILYQFVFVAFVVFSG